MPRLRRLPAALVAGGAASAFVVAGAALLLAVGAAPALGVPTHTTCTWTGAGINGFWSMAVNWSGALAPSSGDALVFPAAAVAKTSLNDLAPGASIGSIQIDGSGYTFSGNAIQLGGGITATLGSATQEFPLDVSLTAPQTMAVNSSAATLTLSGTVSGSSSLTKTGDGTLALTGTPSLTGTLTISAGMLRVDGTTTAPVAANSGGTLGGTGTVGMVGIASGGACSPGGSSTGILTVASLSLASGSTLSIQADGATAGTGYDQVCSDGSVALNGATLSVSGSIASGSSVLKIIDVAGASPVSGTFAGLPEGSTVTVNGVSFILSYAGGDGNDVTLTSGHVPTSFVVSAGDPQSAVVGTAFAVALKVRVLDEGSDPYPGASVTFTAPGSGASGAFATSSTVTTDADGYATAPALTANTLAGSYKVTASTAGLAELSFSLTNTAGLPSSLTVGAGSDQSAPVGTAFTTRLKAQVKDAYGNAVPGADVTFTAPVSGASGTFASSATITSDSAGAAEAPVFTANGTAGSYAVTASCGGVALPVSFSLTNTAAPQITSADSVAFVEGTPGMFTVTATGTPAVTLSQTGALPTGVTFVDNGDGTATLGGAPAPGTAADYDLTLTAANGAGPDATQAFTLHVTAPVPPVTTVSGVPSGWSRRAVRLTFHAAPGQGGPPVAFTEYRLGTGPWRSGDRVTVRSQGATRVTYRSVDTAGDVEAPQVCTVRIDSVRPVVADYGHPVSWQGGAARFHFRVTDRATAAVRARLVITRYGQPARVFKLGWVATGKRLVAAVRCGLPVGTWNWRIVVRDPAGNRGVGPRHALEVYPRWAE